MRKCGAKRATACDSFSFFLPSCRWVRQQNELAKQSENPDQAPKLDLGFKEGQTIKLNIAVKAFAAPNVLPCTLYNIQKHCPVVVVMVLKDSKRNITKTLPFFFCSVLGNESVRNILLVSFVSLISCKV